MAPQVKREGENDEEDMDLSKTRTYPTKCNLSKEKAQDRMEWEYQIHVAEPNIVGTRVDDDDDDDENKYFVTQLQKELPTKGY